MARTADRKIKTSASHWTNSFRWAHGVMQQKWQRTGFPLGEDSGKGFLSH